MLHLVERSQFVAELLEIGGIDLDADNGPAFIVLSLLAILLNEAVAKRIILGETFGEDAEISGGEIPNLIPMYENLSLLHL